MDVKPIDTVYKGYRFRSRLEARWAVFFDAAGIRFEYESQGYKLPDGSCYLPDFYLPDFKAYVEIKPFGVKPIDLDIAKHKCEELFYGMKDIIVVLCLGDPSDDDVEVFCSDSTDSGGGENWWEARFFRKGNVPMLGLIDRRNDREFFTSGWGAVKNVKKLGGYTTQNRMTVEKLKARQARFEHGQIG